MPSIEYIRLLAENLNVKIEDFFQDSEKVLSVPPRKGVPFYDIDVAAHISEVFENEVAPSFWIDFEPFNDCTIYLPIYGESMLPDIQSGDIGAFKLINNINVLLWGEAYLIITGPDANNLRTVKLVFPHEDYSKIILRASNPSFKGDTIIDKAAIISVFMLKGTIKRKQL